MRILVTGATGFIGGRLVRQLVAAGHEVSAVVRDPRRALDLAALGIRVHAGDITDKPSLREPMQGIDALFHLAAWYEIGTDNRFLAEQINVQGTRNVLEAMRDARVPRGVYTSSVAVFSDTRGKLVDETYRRGGPWLTLYDFTKWKAHYEVAEPMIRAGLSLVVVQPGLVYGPGDRSIVHRTFVQYLKRKLSMSPQRTAYCWGYVDDVARGHVLALEKGRPGESYIIAGPMHTFVEVFAAAEKITGVPAPTLHPHPIFVRGLAHVMKLAGAVVPLSESYRYESLRVMAGVTYGGDSRKAERELGWSTRALEDGLRPTLHEAMRELGMTPP